MGLGHNNHQNTPQRINPSHFQGKTIQSIHIGGIYTLALCPDGSLFAWGHNGYGQLGLGHTNEQLTPKLIDTNHFQGKTIQSIHTGDNHTLVLCTDGSLFAWGRNDDGQLGLGHNNNKHTPQPLLDPLERSFRKGHQTLNSNAFFSSTSVDPTSRFLSGYVLQPIESDLSRTQPTTTGLKTNPNN